MPKLKTGFNPFYAALMIVGVAFAISAIVYGIMALRELRGVVPAPGQGGLMAWMSRHGEWLLGVELGLLILLSLAAMLTDDYWFKKQKQPREAESLAEETAVGSGTEAEEPKPATSPPPEAE